MDTPDGVDIDPSALVARLVINDVCRRWFSFDRAAALGASEY
jgi:hypothetical protein